MKFFTQAFNFFEKSYYIYEAAKGKDSIECAESGIKIAKINFLFGNYQIVQKFSLQSMKIYQRNSSPYID